MKIGERIVRSLTIERFLLLCFILAITGTVFSIVVGRIVWNPLLLISIVASAFLSLYFITLLIHARKRVYRILLKGETHSRYEWAARLYPDIEQVIPEEDYVAWITTDREIAAAKVLAIVDVPYTMQELDRADLERRLRAYSSLMSSEEFMIATYQVKFPIDKESYINALRRERDRYRLSYEVGGPKTHLDQSEKLDHLLKRIEEQMREEPVDVRFFIIVMIRANKLSEIEGKFADIMPSIISRFEDDVGVVVKELTHDELLDALRFFPAFPTLENKVRSSSIRPVEALSMDFCFQNPLVVRRMPPLEKLVKGVFIGFTDEKVPVAWNPLIIGNPHAVILGPTRSGKTTLLKSFAARAFDIYGVPVWTFDPSGEFCEYIGSRGGLIVDFKDPKTKVNPLDLVGIDPETRVTKFLEMLAYLAGLTGPERGILREEIIRAFKRKGIDPSDRETWTGPNSSKVTLKEVYETLAKKYEEGKVKPEDRPIVRSIVREKLPAFATGAYAFTSEGDVSVGELVESGKSVCFLLKGVPDMFATALVWTIMDLLNDYMSSHNLSDRIRLIVIIDEAHRYCGARKGDVAGEIIYPPPVKFIKEAGKYGFCEFCATQDVWDLPSVFFNNAGTLIVFGSSDEATLAFYRERVGLSKSDVERLRWFGKGDCFIRFYADPRPIPVHVVPEYIAVNPGGEK